MSMYRFRPVRGVGRAPLRVAIAENETLIGPGLMGRLGVPKRSCGALPAADGFPGRVLPAGRSVWHALRLGTTRGTTTQGTATRGTGTPGTGTRGTGTRGTGTRGTATRGTATRGTATRGTATRVPAAPHAKY